jgi:hypothetical protein
MTKYKTKDVQTPVDGRQVYLNYWWLCEGGDPRKALFVGQSAQCNKDKRIMDMAWENIYKENQGIAIVQIPIAYLPIRN